MSENVQMFVMNKTPEGFREAVEQSGTDDKDGERWIPFY